MEAIRNASVLVVGDAMLDRYWFGDASRISPEAPVPVVKVTRTEDRLGGAANVARNSASLEARTSLLAIIGDDETGTKIMDLLEASKVRPVPLPRGKFHYDTQTSHSCAQPADAEN